VGSLTREAVMANLLCLLFGHQKTLVPFSSNRFYCRRCGLDFGVTVDSVPVATPKVPVLPPVTVKRGAARRLHR
jgi:hypothetical protein